MRRRGSRRVPRPGGRRPARAARRGRRASPRPAAGRRAVGPRAAQRFTPLGGPRPGAPDSAGEPDSPADVPGGAASDPNGRVLAHLANVRTCLMWLRTGMTMIVLGLAAAQFLTRGLVLGVPLVELLAIGLVAGGMLLSAVGLGLYLATRR